MLDSEILLQISILEDVLSITNTLSLVLQTDKKDLGAIRREKKSTITILTEMASNQNTIHLKSFNSQNEVLMEINTRTDCNIVAKGRIELTVEPSKFYSKICQPFLQSLIGMMNTQKLFQGMSLKNVLSCFLLKPILSLLIGMACA